MIRRIDYFSETPDFVMFDLIFSLRTKHFEKDHMVMQEKN